MVLGDKLVKMIYGVSSSIARNYSNAAIETIEFAGKKGFDAVELLCESPNLVPGHVPDPLKNKIREKSLEYNLTLQLHAPFHSLNLASFNEKARELSTQIILNTILLAYELDCKLVTFHLGLCFLPCQIYLNKAFEILVDSLNQIVDFAAEYGITLAAENRGGKLDIGKPPELLKVIKSVNSNFLKITFDTVQANVIGDPLEQYRELKKYVVNVHARDAPRGKDMLLAIGEGEIDFKSLIREFIKDNFYGPLIFEVSSKDRALISRGVIDEILLDILSPEEKM